MLQHTSFPQEIPFQINIIFLIGKSWLFSVTKKLDIGAGDLIEGKVLALHEQLTQIQLLKPYIFSQSTIRSNPWVKNKKQAP